MCQYTKNLYTIGCVYFQQQRFREALTDFMSLASFQEQNLKEDMTEEVGDANFYLGSNMVLGKSYRQAATSIPYVHDRVDNFWSDSLWRKNTV